MYFNPRTPCGVRPKVSYSTVIQGKFQSTHPVWGATCTWMSAHTTALISIHAPRVGCDLTHLSLFSGIGDFNPRTPCGVRRFGCNHCGRIIQLFQSTHPVWGATGLRHSHRPNLKISIHAPRVGCDVFSSCGTTWPCNFNPRTPCGVRPGNADCIS